MFVTLKVSEYWLWDRQRTVVCLRIAILCELICGETSVKVLVVVTSGIHNSSLSTTQLYLRSAISFHFFFSFCVHRSTPQFFSLPRRKGMYHFHCTANVPNGGRQLPFPKPVCLSHTCSFFLECEYARSLLGSQLRLDLYEHSKVAGWGQLTQDKPERTPPPPVNI